MAGVRGNETTGFRIPKKNMYERCTEREWRLCILPKWDSLSKTWARGAVLRYDYNMNYKLDEGCT